MPRRSRSRSVPRNRARSRGRSRTPKRVRLNVYGGKDSSTAQTVHPPKLRAKSAPVIRAHGSVKQKVDHITDVIMRSMFLKCAFAPFDEYFDFDGVPDGDTSLAVARRFEYNSSSLTVAANTTTYLHLVPSLGVCYITSSTLNPATTTTATQVVYNDFNTIAPGNGNLTFTEFRLASAALQLSNTTPIGNRGGSVIVATASYQAHPIIQTSGNLAVAITGNPPDISSIAYVDTFDQGVTVSIKNTDQKWDYKPVFSGIQYNATGTFSLDMDNNLQLRNTSTSAGFVIRGWDHEFETKVIAITAPSTAQTISVRAIQCAQMKVEPGTILYGNAKPSPKKNHVDLDIYGELANALPVAMRRSDNPGFWDGLRGIVHRVTTALSVVPGPIGMISGGVSALTL